MSDKPDITAWRMTEETIPERPDDPEWRKSVGLLLVDVAALAVSLGLVLVRAEWAFGIGGLLLAAVCALRYRHWLDTLGKK